VLSAATRVAGVIGDPVHHSLSPAIHNAGFAALGLDWVYVAFPVAAGQAGAAVAALRTLGLAGLSVTMPHKAAAATTVDRLSPTAAHLGVVNTIYRHGDELVGDCTDGPGFVDALRADHGWDPHGRRVVVLGTGGAARAVALALAGSGAAEVAVVGRDAASAASCAALARRAGVVRAVDAVAGADLVVNATPVGMAGTGSEETLPLGVEPDRIGEGQLVVDLVYAPAVTPLLAAARARGAATGNGLGMLVHQAARQLGLWTGEPAPVEAMRSAAIEAQRQRSPT
jgi:shikimate dehydrogenase